MYFLPDNPELVITECKTPTPENLEKTSDFQSPTLATDPVLIKTVTDEAPTAQIGSEEVSTAQFGSEETIEIANVEQFEETVTEIVKSVLSEVAQEMSEELDGAILELDFKMNQ